jgi:hypothetical protein
VDPDLERGTNGWLNIKYSGGSKIFSIGGTVSEPENTGADPEFEKR